MSTEEQPRANRRAADASGDAEAMDQSHPEEHDHHEWISTIEVVDRPGALMTLAAVFSARGVNLTYLATGHQGAESTMLTFGFEASTRRARQLARTVDRMTSVLNVVTRRSDDDLVRAAGVARFSTPVAFRPPRDASVSWSGRAERGEVVLFEGPYRDARLVESAARAAGAEVSGLVVVNH